MATHVYVDAFNLYYGALKGSASKWLDLDALCQRLLPSDDIQQIRYFTALVSARPDDPDQPQRQLTYLRALRTIPHLSIHLGHHVTRRTKMALAQPVPGVGSYVDVLKTEEKGFDVNLATFLLLDGCAKACETAVVISNDSDLKESIRAAQRDLGLKVGVINPHPASRRSRALEPTFFKQLRRSILPACQFPRRMSDADGAFHRPAAW